MTTISRTLPAGIVVSIAARPGFALAVLKDENGIQRPEIYGIGTNKNEAIANLTDRYFVELHDGRTGEHLLNTAWIHRSGTKRRVPASEVDQFVADGWSKGKGVSGPNIRTLRKLEAAQTVQ